MSLNGALEVGRSGIVASQAGIQVAGNNMANAATEGYSRQVVRLTPARGQTIGFGSTIGLGVQLQSITRQVDTAIQARLRDAISNEQGAVISQRFLSAIESIQNELSDNDLSTLMSDFFNGFSELANNPEDQSIRSVVVQTAVNLADRMNQLRTDYTSVRNEINRDIGVSVERVDAILGELSIVNRQIAETEFGVGPANGLRDQRDLLVNELSEFMEVNAIEQPNGAVDVFVGSVPIVLAGQSRGVELREESVDGEVVVSIRIKDDQSRLDIDSGRLGGLLASRDGAVEPAIAAIDQLAAALIQQVNRVHSQGQGQHGYLEITGQTRVYDSSLNLNNPNAELPFRIENGSFEVHITHPDSGERMTEQILVDGNAMSLDDLVATLNASIDHPGFIASISPDNSLNLEVTEGYELSFSDDTSGALAALGMNTIFAGENATDIAINEVIINDLQLLAAGSGHTEGSNSTALAIAALQDEPNDAINGQSLREFWQQSVNELAVKTNTANAKIESSRLVRENLSAQMQAVSGVSLDEEAINLLSFQRQFQAAARFISVIDETLETLLSIA